MATCSLLHNWFTDDDHHFLYPLRFWLEETCNFFGCMLIEWLAKHIWPFILLEWLCTVASFLFWPHFFKGSYSKHMLLIFLDQPIQRQSVLHIQRHSCFSSLFPHKHQSNRQISQNNVKKNCKNWVIGKMQRPKKKKSFF